MLVSYAFGSIDEMGEGVFRKVRQELGVTRQGLNKLLARLAIDTANAAAFDRPDTPDRPTIAD